MEFKQISVHGRKAFVGTSTQALVSINLRVKHTGEVRGIVERVESDLSTSKTHDDSKNDLKPSTLHDKGHKELRVVREKQRRKDKEVTPPDLGSVLLSGEVREMM